MSMVHRWQKRYPALVSALLALFVSIGLIGCGAPAAEPSATVPPSAAAAPSGTQSTEKAAGNSAPSTSSTPVAAATVPRPAAPTTSAPSPQSGAAQGWIAAHVTKVVDGDTMDVSYNGKQDTIRLLLIDTPETHKPDTPVEPFGPEASAYAEQVLAGRDVKLELDGPQRDKYGRLLCYLWVGDQLFNKMQIEKGYARVAYVYDPPYKHYDELLAAEQKAKNAGIGIWSIPGYVTDEGYNPAAAGSMGNTAGSSAPAPNDNTASVYYRNCAQVRAAGKAPLHRGDPGYRTQLDRDGDGIACE
ncbi:thermonuclease family protein [Kyrpidia sp.]|uniref:thermonuclease family protein n=1 Tax=Kyrpidia sp. TaxID=2073077 RepID=UPI00258C2D02|nr:thermonuclease family protein [Kyrpidia sp.]